MPPEDEIPDTDQDDTTERSATPSHPQGLGENSAVMWLGIVETHFPSFPDARQELRDWHRAKFPHLYPVDPPPIPPGSFRVPVTVTSSGPVVGGVPFGIGEITASDAAAWCVESGSAVLPVKSKVLSTYPDGSVQWLRVSWNAVAGPATLVASGVPGSGPWIEPTWGPKPSWATLGGNIQSVALDSTTVEGRTFLRVRNTTPTGVSANQPTCANFGTPEERAVTLTVAPGGPKPRWASIQGLAQGSDGSWALLAPGKRWSILRAGEQKTFELSEAGGEPPLMLCSEARYRTAGASGAIAGGPIPSWSLDEPEFEVYEAHVALTIDYVDNHHPPSHWKNPGDAGCLQRDWDGGDPAIDFQTHGHEYDLDLGFGRQGLRIPRSGSDPRVPANLHLRALQLMIRGSYHGADAHVYHIHAGPLSWMYGGWWQHPRHGGSGQGSQHRSSFPPNSAHQNGRALLLTWYMTGAPHLLDAWREVADRARLLVEQWAPPAPGYANLSGEERAAGNMIALLLDDWKLTGDPDTEAACQKAIDEGIGKRSWAANGDATDKCKPWQVAYMGKAMLECEVAGFSGNNGLRQLLAGEAYVEDPPLSHVQYQLNPPEPNAHGKDFWNLYASDCLCVWDPEKATKLFKTGSVSPWYPGAQPGYTKLLNSGGLCCAGQFYMTSKGR